MALEATHLRFALEFKAKLKVNDLGRYILGTIYPDSRYLTKIERILTHPDDFRNWHLSEIDDFQKGWYIHLLADYLQREVTREKLPQVGQGELKHGSDAWVEFTALKILEDINDAKAFTIEKYLPYLNAAENPNGEDLAVVKEYHQIFLKMYENPAVVNITSGYEMWQKFGIGEELAQKVKAQAEKFDQEPSIKSALKNIYPEMVKRAHESLSRNHLSL